MNLGNEFLQRQQIPIHNKLATIVKPNLAKSDKKQLIEALIVS